MRASVAGAEGRDPHLLPRRGLAPFPPPRGGQRAPGSLHARPVVRVPSPSLGVWRVRDEPGDAGLARFRDSSVALRFLPGAARGPDDGSEMVLRSLRFEERSGRVWRRRSLGDRALCRGSPLGPRPLCCRGKSRAGLARRRSSDREAAWAGAESHQDRQREGASKSRREMRILSFFKSHFSANLLKPPGGTPGVRSPSCSVPSLTGNPVCGVPASRWTPGTGAPRFRKDVTSSSASPLGSGFDFVAGGLLIIGTL